MLRYRVTGVLNPKECSSVSYGYSNASYVWKFIFFLYSTTLHITLADVAENLMPESLYGGYYTEICLGNLNDALEKEKEDIKLKGEME